MKVVLVTGGFDPLHSGNLQYFKEAKKLGDVLHVGLNSDEWLSRKKGRPFMPFSERVTILEALEVVDKVISFDDTDDSACGAIYKTMATNSNVEIVFANGGDRSLDEIPETAVMEKYNIKMVDGLGDKIRSSSDLTGIGK